jgi:phage-related protein
MPLFLVDVMNIIKRMIDALFDSIMRVVEFKGHLEPDE